MGTRSIRAARRAPRALALACAAIASAGLTTAPAHAATASAEFACERGTSSGLTPARVTLDVTTALPATAVFGVPTSATPATVTIGIPAGALGSLSVREGTAVVTGVATGARVDVPFSLTGRFTSTWGSTTGQRLTFTADLPALSFSDAGEATLAVTGLDLTLSLQSNVDGLPTPPETGVSPCKPVEGQNLTLGTIRVQSPYDVTVRNLTPTAASVCAPTLPVPPPAIYRYVVFDGSRVLAAGLEGCVPVAGLVPSTLYTLTVKSTIAGGPVDSPDNLTERGSVTFRTPDASNDPTPPSATVGKITETSAEVCAPSRLLPAVAWKYVVFNGTTVVSASQNRCQIVAGLTPDTQYTLNVRSGPLGSAPVDSLDGLQLDEGTVSFRTRVLASIDPAYQYGLEGSATLKTLAQGVLPLGGTLKKVVLRLNDGAFSGDLALQPTRTTLIAYGFLPVGARVEIVPTERLAGTLKGGILDTRVKARIKLPSVTLFGVPLAGGPNCQTRQVSSIALTSITPGFSPLAGGALAGTFAIGDLAGCGFLTGIVSPLTAGAGNVIALNATPLPPNG